MSRHESAPPAGAGDIGAFETVTDAWVRASYHLANSAVEANRATLAAFGFADESDADGAESVAYERTDWATERSVDRPEAISVGDTVRFTKRFTDEDVRTFAAVSGDTNRLHLDDEFAEATRFEGRIVHGTLVSGVISAALARLPGLTIYLSQDLQFSAPVDVGDRVTAVVEVVEAIGDGRYRLVTDVVDEDGRTYVEGEAVVLVDALPDDSEGAEA